MSGLLLTVAALVIWLAHRSRPIPPLAWGVPLAALAPFIHLIPAGEAFAPRFAHISTMFLIPLADDLLRRLAAPLHVAILLILGGSTWLSSQNYRDAEAYWQASLEHAPSSPVAWNALGLSHADVGRHEEAIAAYRSAIAHDPSHSRAWSNLARSLLATGRKAEAVQSLEAAVRAGPTNPIAHTNWGLHLERVGDHRMARESFSRATELRPGMPQAWAGLARVERQLGRVPEALRAEQRLRDLGITPGN